jgi:hypothetical protein
MGLLYSLIHSRIQAGLSICLFRLLPGEGSRKSQKEQHLLYCFLDKILLPLRVRGFCEIAKQVDFANHFTAVGAGGLPARRTCSNGAGSWHSHAAAY